MPVNLFKKKRSVYSVHLKPEGIEIMDAIGASYIPTLCTDGEIPFVLNIPSVNEIRKAIETRLKGKFK